MCVCVLQKNELRSVCVCVCVCVCVLQKNELRSLCVCVCVAEE